MSSQSSLTPISEETIREILSETNLALRNLKITWCYHLLSQDTRTVIGAKNNNWCTFAKWASKTAGYSIRNEIFGDRLSGLLSLSDEYSHAMDDLNSHLRGIGEDVHVESNELAHYLSETLISTSDQVSRGNFLVFEELAPLFVRFIADFRGLKRDDPARIQAFLARLTPGSVHQGGQDMLRQAFEAYYYSIFVKGKEKAELIFLANLMIGVHEQPRLQSPIEEALKAPLSHGLRSHLEGAWPKGASDMIREPVNEAIGRFHSLLLKPVTRVWHRFAVEVIMSMRLPRGELALGSDVPNPIGGPMFPREQETIDNAELGAVLQRWDRTLNTTRGSGACDWTDLDDRMNYVADLFRSRQQRRVLRRPPFAVTQAAEIEAGQVPAGQL